MAEREVTASAAHQKQFDKARRGALPPEFPRYADLVDLVIRAETATQRHVEFVARWQAAGSPRDAQHPASDDLLAAHSEATYVRECIDRTLQRGVAKLELEQEIARHHPREGQIVVIVHARIAKLERRPLKLPSGLSEMEPEPAVKWTPPHQRRRRAVGAQSAANGVGRGSDAPSESGRTLPGTGGPTVPLRADPSPLQAAR
jgi:hypothetical protein